MLKLWPAGLINNDTSESSVLNSFASQPNQAGSTCYLPASGTLNTEKTVCHSFSCTEPAKRRPFFSLNPSWKSKLNFVFHSKFALASKLALLAFKANWFSFDTGSFSLDLVFSHSEAAMLVPAAETEHSFIHSNPRLHWSLKTRHPTARVLPSLTPEHHIPTLSILFFFCNVNYCHIFIISCFFFFDNFTSCYGPFLNILSFCLVFYIQCCSIVTTFVHFVVFRILTLPDFPPFDCHMLERISPLWINVLIILHYFTRKKTLKPTSGSHIPVKLLLLVLFKKPNLVKSLK